MRRFFSPAEVHLQRYFETVDKLFFLKRSRVQAVVTCVSLFCFPTSLVWHFSDVSS